MSYTIADLQYLMSRLRDPETGCPWDLKQTFSSVVPHTLEEVYELVDAIEQGDSEQIRQELGDVLFQVIFYSQLATEAADFSFADVVNDIVEKLLRRHPHVFPDGQLTSVRNADAPADAAINARWEEIKQQEREQKSQLSAMDDVPQALPALTRAAKLQKRASQEGFDWTELRDVVAALRAEIDELDAAIALADPADIADEMGDVLFSAINVARHLKLDAEAVTRGACRKFERRYRFVEQRCRETGHIAVKGQENSQLELFWQEAKATGL
ncbi:MAG: nucleoside triphosphate pyrophosphohydrolase [Zhongshania sp.]|uniref:nucleoside triphosphate pyrophosphohydrolase n=1 Tax=Zhongshania sp. TaxID=1971902 RepID=UPI002620CAB4|nr:nucleoside triphosphate pyrophosphohydrolase [Zhongshania sp.]MDF1690987.1 nucleoside triphosphate pyrophosphohydrolase [Zhongshania sp.]